MQPVLQPGWDVLVIARPAIVSADHVAIGTALGRLLGVHVQRLATIAHGDGVCTTCIPQNLTTDQKTDPTKEQS